LNVILTRFLYLREWTQRDGGRGSKKKVKWWTEKTKEGHKKYVEGHGESERNPTLKKSREAASEEVAPSVPVEENLLH